MNRCDQNEEIPAGPCGRRPARAAVPGAPTFSRLLTLEVREGSKGGCLARWLSLKPTASRRSLPELAIAAGRKVSLHSSLRDAATIAQRFAVFARLALYLLLLSISLTALGEARFPPPDFVETSHQIPLTATPQARALLMSYLDVVVLAGALGLATWMVYGSTLAQGPGLALALFDGLFRVLAKRLRLRHRFAPERCLGPRGQQLRPALGCAGFLCLAAGRDPLRRPGFCAGVCPHGALQDLLLLKPVKIPPWLENGLSLLPFVYLGVGVLFAATGSTFLICQDHPFIPIFRLSGRTLMVLTGVGFLLLSVFVGRPYCRFLCPYGALLKLGATVSKRRVRVTPDTCTQCRLCEHSCPFGAMREPQASNPDPATLALDRRRLTWLIVLAPVLIAALGWLGSRFSTPASRLHATVSLAEHFVREHDAPPKTGALSPDDLAFERARQNPRALLTEAAAIRHRFKIGGWVLRRLDRAGHHGQTRQPLSPSPAH